MLMLFLMLAIVIAVAAVLIYNNSRGIGKEIFPSDLGKKGKGTPTELWKHHENHKKLKGFKVIPFPGDRILGKTKKHEAEGESQEDEPQGDSIVNDSVTARVKPLQESGSEPDKTLDT